MQDHRKFVRWQAGKSVQIKLEGGETFFSCQVEDLNFMGMRISTALKLPEDTFLKMTVALSEQMVMDVEVWVVWHKAREGRNSYGLYFAKIKDPDKEMIYQFMRQYFPTEMNKQWWRGLEKEEAATEDRRIFARFPAKLSMRFINSRENREAKAQTQDISAKGIGMVASENLALHTPLEMWLDVPDQQEPLYTRGEVVWSKMIAPNQYRVGVCLEKADLMGLSRVLKAA